MCGMWLHSTKSGGVAGLVFKLGLSSSMRTRLQQWVLPAIVCFLGLAMIASCARSERGRMARADLVIINGTEPETLDPAVMTGFAEMRIAMAMFEGLTRPDPVTGAAVPGLAARWEVSSDGLVYRFYLRPGLKWSTGEPITAEDVRYSWLRVLNPETAADYAALFFCIKGAEAYYYGRHTNADCAGLRVPADDVVEVELTRPTPYFPDLCALPVFAVVPRQVIERMGERWLKARPLPVSGAFELVHWRINHSIRLRKNPNYWDAANTMLETVDILPVGSPATALNLYLTGYADIIWDKDMVPIELLDILAARPDFHRFDYLATYFIRFNVTRPPFDDVRVRKAFALAIDKERIVRRITRAGERVARGLVPPGTANHEPTDGLGYDPERARALLAEAGYPNGRGFPLVVYTFDAAARGAAKLNGKIAVELQQMWQETLGVRVELRQLERRIFFSAQSRLEYQISRSSWVADYNDPSTFLDLFVSNNGNNRTGWKCPEYDALIARAHAEPDPVVRARLFHEAERMLVEEAVPIVPIFHFTGMNVYDPERIVGIHQNLLDLHPLNAIRKVNTGTGSCEQRNGGGRPAVREVPGGTAAVTTTLRQNRSK